MTALNSMFVPSHARPPVAPLKGPATTSNLKAMLRSSLEPLDIAPHPNPLPRHGERAYPSSRYRRVTRCLCARRQRSHGLHRRRSGVRSSMQAGHAGRVQPDAHHRADGGDVHRLEVVVTEAHVRRVMVAHVDAANDTAVGIVHPDAARPRAVNPSLHVAFEAIRIARIRMFVLEEQSARSDAAIGLHVVRANHALT